MRNVQSNTEFKADRPWLIGCHIVNQEPDTPPQTCYSHEEAKKSVIDWIIMEQECAESYEEAETLSLLSAIVDVQSGAFNVTTLDKCYWAKQVPVESGEAVQ